MNLTYRLATEYGEVRERRRTWEGVCRSDYNDKYSG